MGSNIGLFEIASAAGDLFIHSQDINQKRLLLRFIFESLQIKEGTIHYKLNFPFSEMEKNSNSSGNSSEPLSSNGYSEKTCIFKTEQKTSIRTVENEVKTKGCVHKMQPCTNWLGWLDASIPTHKTLFCVKSIIYLNIVWGVNLKVISSFH